MRRTLLSALLAGVAAFASAAQAAPSPQVTDAKADWPVESQDVLSARLSSRLVNRKPALHGELTLAVAPSATVPTTYRFSFMRGCVYYAFVYDWKGAAGTAVATFTRQECLTGAESPVEMPKETAFPVTFTLRGTTLDFVAPYAGGIARGSRLTAFGAMAYTVPFAAVYGDSWTGYHEVWSGDVAWSDATYVAGSDLPRT